MQSLIGVDIGGTSVKLGLIQSGEQFRVLRQSSIPTQTADPAERFVQRVAEAVKALIREAGSPPVAGVGVGCPGLVNPWAGVSYDPPNMKNIDGFPLRDRLAELLKLPVEIQNDANAAVLGEWLFSPASKGIRNMCLLTLGTGIGGGVICDGHLVVGADNAATELGHLKVDYSPDAPVCGCRRRGCVEAFAGAAGITRIADAMLKSGRPTSLTPGALTTKDIAQAAAAGDAVAREALSVVGAYLGRVNAHIIDTFNPEKIVFSGGASAAYDLLYPAMAAAMKQYCSYDRTRNRCKLERSAFPDDINVIGAAATYLNAHR